MNNLRDARWVTCRQVSVFGTWRGLLWDRLQMALPLETMLPGGFQTLTLALIIG